MSPRSVAPRWRGGRLPVVGWVVGMAMVGWVLAACACSPRGDGRDAGVAEQTVAFAVRGTVSALAQWETRMPSPAGPTPCTGSEAVALGGFLSGVQGWVAEERAITDSWNALAYAAGGNDVSREEKIDGLDQLATRVGVVWHAVAELPAPEGCEAIRDQYVVALRKHHQFYLLTKSYVQTGDERYRTLANQEREEATRSRREVWGMLGDLEYWLEQHPCRGPDVPWPALEGAASIWQVACPWRRTRGLPGAEAHPMVADSLFAAVCAPQASEPPRDGLAALITRPQACGEEVDVPSGGC